MITIKKSSSNTNNSEKSQKGTETSINRAEAINSKPGTQIKITRTPTGSVEFTTVPAGTPAVPGNGAGPGHGHGHGHSNGHGHSHGHGFVPQMPPSRSMIQSTPQVCR